MQPSPNVTLPLITASWQMTVLGAPPRADTPPLAECLPLWRPDAPSVVLRAETRPVVADSVPRPDVRPDAKG